MARKVSAKEGWIIMRGSEYEFPPNIYESEKRCKEVISNLEKIDPKKYSGLTPKNLDESKQIKKKRKSKSIEKPVVILNNDVNVLDI